MISSYEYKILRFIRRRKNCTSAHLIRRFGPGSVERANALHEYIDRPFIREPDGSYSSIQEDNYFLTDAGHFALSEYRYTFSLKIREAVFISAVSAFFGALFAFLFSLD